MKRIWKYLTGNKRLNSTLYRMIKDMQRLESEITVERNEYRQLRILHHKRATKKSFEKLIDIWIKKDNPETYKL